MFFETILVSDGAMPLWRWHWKRIMYSAVRLHCRLPTCYRELLADYIHKHMIVNAVLRLSYVPECPDFPIIVPRALPKSWDLSMPVFPEQKKSHTHDGLKLIDRTYYNSATAFANALGYGSALILNQQGQPCETTIGNIWLQKDGLVITPPLSSGCVAGVQRAKILNDGSVFGMPIVERPLELHELPLGQLYMSNAIRGIYPIKIAG